MGLYRDYIGILVNKRKLLFRVQSLKVLGLNTLRFRAFRVSGRVYVEIILNFWWKAIWKLGLHRYMGLAGYWGSR